MPFKTLGVIRTRTDDWPRQCAIFHKRVTCPSLLPYWLQVRELHHQEAYMEKQTYTQPQLEVIGSITDLTRTGLTRAGSDGKGGSAASEGA